MSNMTNFSEKPTRNPWNIEPQIAGSTIADYALPASTITFYDGQAVGRDASGNLVQMDDTAQAEFIGFQTDVAGPLETIVSTDTLGEKWAQGIDRPYSFKVLIAAAAKGQEGKRVYWLYNNQVAYSGTTYDNFAGTVIGVPDSTHVIVLAPWARGYTQGGGRGIRSLAATGTSTLTKWDVNSTILAPLTSSATIRLPAAVSVSPDDVIVIINTTANSSTPTIAPPASGTGSADTINGSSSYTMGTTQYTTASFRSDGISAWYVGTAGPSGSQGATTFTGNSGTSSATFTVSDNVAQTFAVGPNGATNPAFEVDTSVSSAATGINIIGRAAGSGVTLATVTSGSNEDLLIAPAGTGGVKITTTSANGLAVGANGSTNPVFNVVASTSSVKTGVSVTGAAAASGVALAATSNATNEALTLDAKGSGVVTIGSVSTGGVKVRLPVATVAAAGTAIGNAAAVTEGFTYCTGSNNANAVILPVGAVGMQVTLQNASYTAALIVFPQVSSAINNLTANASYNIAIGAKRTLVYAAANQWYTDLATIS